MSLMHLSQTMLEIPFNQVFTHATATRACTESVLVKATNSQGLIGLGEGCPRSYVTGETLKTAQVFFETNRPSWENLQGLEDLRTWMADNVKRIDANPAAWCAVELALLDLWGQESGQSLEALLGLFEVAGSFHYSAVLGTDRLITFQKQATQFLALGFVDFKVKVSGCLEDDQHKIDILKGLGLEHLRIRLDANNLWKNPEEVVAYLEALHFPFLAIEEPLQVGDYEGCRRLNRQSGLPVILDESFLRADQFSKVQSDPQSWIINIRISKMGGLLRSLRVAKQVREAGIPIIIGAQVGETSILTRAALTVAHQCRASLLAQEGAFGTYLLEHDITDIPLMFGKGGRLEASSISNHCGLGLTFAHFT
ncbi:enolase C-terminal domain-like protein [uncultured Nitrospira sp.]|uniref:mandelate racemase/muconate lactonizing enzyme family protein n=1 Tax=uncultured Nitrospira sp. TaxID=157176 RepID=UPI0031409A57